MAHFFPPFYLWVGKYAGRDFPELMERNMRKAERDYNEKILFDEERKMVKEQYDILKKWFNYKIV